MKKSILILFGGMSTEHEVSCVSASFIADSADKNKYDVYKMGITKNGAWYIYNGPVSKMADNTWTDDTENLKPAILSPCSLHHGIMILDKPVKKYEIINIDVAVPVLHGKNGEDGTIQGLLEVSGIPYVGCDTYSSAVCMDKIATKILCTKAGIKNTPFIHAKNIAGYDINRTVCEAEETFEYPMFVKPANSGSSVGVTKAANRAELVYGIETAFKNDNKLLIEKAVKGREIEVAMFGNLDAYASECGEIDPGGDVFYDYDTKYKLDTAKYYIPARLEPQVAEKVKNTAISIYKLLDCRGLARVDFFVTDDNNIIFNEINTMPGFTSISMYPRLMEHGGKPAARLIDGLIGLALEES